MTVNITDVLRSVNKAIGAVIGGGVIALLVGLHVIPAGVGNTLLSVLGAAAAVLGAFLAPSNKPINTNPDVPAAELDAPVAHPLPDDGIDTETEAALAAEDRWPAGTPQPDA